MRNPNANLHGFSDEPWKILMKCSLLLVFVSSSFDAQVIDSDQNHNLEWQVLTNSNFSSQTHLHHHVLLIVTVPWSGEARSLMKNVADAASHKLEKLDDLRLMVLYKDKEKTLADALGVIEETTIFFYYHAVSYRYQGRLRAQNILSSLDYMISSQVEELPLKLLNTPEELHTFFQSTDKAVLLFEFCGWTSRLLAQEKNNGTEHGSRVANAANSGIISGTNSYGETIPNLTSNRDKNQKELDNEKLTCDTDSGLREIPWVGGFTTTNHSASAETENKLPGVGLSCTFDEFQQFESFFSKFMTFAREFFLPPERQRFGLISERYLLSSLGVRDPNLWLGMINFAGCSNCSKILKTEDDLKTALSMQHPLITELEREGHDVGSALPGNKPSVILFVDRSSESLDTRIKSKSALETFTKLALHSQHSYRTAVPDSTTHRKPSYRVVQGPKGGSSSYSSKYSSRDISQLTGFENLKNKMSVMIINEDGNIALDDDAQGRSIHDILSHLLLQRNEAKLSYVAKEVGFQLLSDDFEVKLADLLQPQVKTSTSEKVFSEASTGNNVEVGQSLDRENTVNDASSNALDTEVLTAVTEFESSLSKEEKVTYIVKNIQMPTSAPNQMVAGNTPGAAHDVVEGSSSTPVDKEVGFQLLSDDFEVKLADLLQPQVKTSASEKVFSEASRGNNVEGGQNLNRENTLNDASSNPLDTEVRTGVTEFESSPSKEEKITYFVKNIQMPTSVPNQMAADNTPGAAHDVVEGSSSTPVDKLEVQQPYHEDLLGFYFSDGGYHLLNSLTSRSEVPSMIIVDPISEQHFIYPQEEVFSYSSLEAFLDAFLNGSLTPYQRSEPVIVGPREATQPPFINLNFRAVDSIPRVTAHTFSELVLGLNQSDDNTMGNSWNKDVMVLFSNTWCGFCQRMELVVREVFRAFKGYPNARSGHSKRESSFDTDVTEDAKLTEFSLIFLMDCTLNDCSALLKSLGQREVYPTLLLFPAQKKTAISYQGDMSVHNVMKFLIDHGSNSHDLNREEGILWTARQGGGEDGLKKYDEVVPRERTPHHNVVVGSVLIATEKLLSEPPFDKSTILIVQTNQSTGFQGLIINKRISWDSFEALNKGLELAKKAPLSFGGPLIANGMPLVSLTRRVIADGGYLEVLPSVYFLDQWATVGEIEGFKSGNQSSDDYWFFLGYSSWGREQLFAEIAEGVWLISDDPMADFTWPTT